MPPRWRVKMKLGGKHAVPKSTQLSTRLHGVSSQKTVIFIVELIPSTSLPLTLSLSQPLLRSTQLPHLSPAGYLTEFISYSWSVPSQYPHTFYATSKIQEVLSNLLYSTRNVLVTSSSIWEILRLQTQQYQKSYRWWAAYRVIILFDKYLCRFPLLLCRRGGHRVDCTKLKKIANKSDVWLAVRRNLVWIRKTN